MSTVNDIFAYVPGDQDRTFPTAVTASPVAGLSVTRVGGASWLTFNYNPPVPPPSIVDDREDFSLLDELIEAAGSTGDLADWQADTADDLREQCENAEAFDSAQLDAIAERDR